jgi:exodeoxyribonuclease-3
VRLFAWNIRQGGGTRLAAITAALIRRDADVAVISEYRGGPSAERLRAALCAAGYNHMTAVAPLNGCNGGLIAARHPFREHGVLSVPLPEPFRIVGIDLEGIRMFGVYMPNMMAKVPYWEALLGALSEAARTPAIAIGDFNSCRAYVDEAGAIDKTAHFFEKIEAAGFCDLWRDRNPDRREFSWYSTRGNGFRIDHAFLSRTLAARAGPIRYSHAEALAGVSDHSLLILDIDG